MKRILNQYFRITKTLCFNFFRDRMALFFVLALPLIFMIIFGFLYAGEGSGQFRAAVYQNTAADNGIYGELLDVISARESLTYHEVSSFEEGQKMVRDLQADFFIQLQENGLEVFYNPVRIEDNPALEQQINSLTAELDRQRAGLQELIAVNTVNEAGSQESSGQLEFMFPGLIALGLASAGLFVFAETFMSYREKKVLKRMAASPMDRKIFLISLMSSRLPMAFLSSLLVLGVGRMLFGITFVVSWPLFVPYILVGTVVMMSFGALITLFTSTAESASQVASIFLTIMIFFSGIYFPREFLPSYFYRISFLLPLSYIGRGLRFIMDVGELSGAQFLLETIILLAASGLIIYIVSVRLRWVE